MGDFQVILAALLSPDNDTRSQAEVSKGHTCHVCPTVYVNISVEPCVRVDSQGTRLPMQS